MSANSTQIGGAHYKASDESNHRAALLHFPKVPEHWDIVYIHDLDYFQAAITKYVMRHKKKNGLEDLKKAQHFLTKYIELLEAEAEASRLAA